MSMPDLNQGALAPVNDEVDVQPLRVTGKIPLALEGTLIRNGPNPLNGRFAGTGVLNWWPEAAMLHGIRLENGQAIGYRNRWVRTKHWADAQPKVDNTLGQTTQLDSNPNVNVIQHAGQVLALAEGGVPAVINEGLDTLGPAAQPLLAQGITAHPKRDARTGELMLFRADWGEPHLRYGVIDSAGNTRVNTIIDVAEPSMMHDMATTATHSILLDLNVAYDFSMLANGHRIPIRWKPQRQSRLGVIPRHGGPVIWLEIDPCFIQHVVNAYDAPNGNLVLDVARYPTYFELDQQGETFLPNPLAVLWRYTINLQTQQVAEQPLDEVNIELPRINEAHCGYPNRYCYAVVQPTDAEMRGVIAYDLAAQTSTLYAIPAPDQNSEPVFVPKPLLGPSLGASLGAKANDPFPGSFQDNENNGWLLVCVYRDASQTTELHILDAADIEAGPVAVVDLARRIPAGFHGAWIPAG